MNTSSSINVRLLFFAKTRELAGVNETTIQLPESVVVAELLLNKICSQFHLDIIKSNIILAVNENYCDDLQETLHLKEGDEIAVIPPISGG